MYGEKLKFYGVAGKTGEGGFSSLAPSSDTYDVMSS